MFRCISDSGAPMRNDSYYRKLSRYVALFLILLVIFSIPAVTADPLPDIRHIFVGVANDDGVKYDLDGPVFGGPDNTYYIKADGGGLNELHISIDVAQASGQVSTATNQSGTFYVTNTGGRGFDDDIVILLAVNGTIPDDFSVHVKTSGYNWTTSSVPNQVPTDYAYVEGAVDETFTKADFIYGPQTWKPGPGTLGVPSLPLYFGQDISDTSNAFQLMFIDLKVGNMYPSKFSGVTLENNGASKVEFSFTNLTSFATFNGYGWCLAANQGQGISWTNRMDDPGASGYSVVGIPYVPSPAPVADFTANPISGEVPLTVQFTDASTGSPTSWAWDFENDGVVDSTDQNPVYTYTIDGNYSVNLTVTNDGGIDSEVKTDYIKVTQHTPKTWTVGATGADYTEIWDALVNPQLWDGDTVFVYNGTYTDPDSGSLQLYREISLIGEGRDQVLYNAGRTKYFYSPVEIEGISFLNSTRTVDLRGENTVIRNCAFDTFAKINFYAHNIRFENNIVNAGNYLRVGGFSFYPSDNNIIANNTFSNMGRVIWLGGSNQTIADNVFTSCTGTEVIFVDMLSGSTFARNTFTACTGALLRMNSPGDGNLVCFNDFDSLNPITYNGPQGAISWNATQPVTYVYQGTSYTGYPGNYWAGYTGTDGDGNGLGDEPFVIPPSYGDPFHFDYEPLLGSYRTYIGDSGPQSLTADFTANPVSGELPLIVQFSDISTGNPTSWAWDFNNDGVLDSTGQNPAYMYTTAGTYTVNLTVTNDGESASEVKTDYITVAAHTPRTWTVGATGADYTEIWDALVNPQLWDGDTVFVYNGTYNDPDSGSLQLYREISLIGEGRDQVLYNAGRTKYFYSPVEIEGISFLNSTRTVDLRGENTVIRNCAFDTFAKINFYAHNIRFENNIVNAGNYLRVGGFSFYPSDNNIIANNTFSNMGRVIWLGGSNQTIADNVFTSCTGSEVIFVDMLSGSTFARNTFTSCTGALLRMNSPGDGNLVCFNDFDSSNPVTYNGPQGAISWNTTQPVTYTYQGVSHAGYLGNHWAGYTGTDSDGNGLGDEPFVVPPSFGDPFHFDYAPLMGSYQDYLVDFASQSPTAYFTANVTSGEAPFTITFTDLSTGSPTSWAWDFENDGIVDCTDQNPVYTYTTAGTYSVSLTVTSEDGTDSEIRNDYITVSEPSGPTVLSGYNNIFVRVANDDGVKYNAFDNHTYNIRFEGINRGLNALHISTDPSVNFGQVTVTDSQSGTFYATDSGGKGYEDEIILLVAVNGTIPDDFSLHITSDGYTWTPNPVSNQPPALDTVTYQPLALDETFTKEDFIYGPQIWKPTGNEADYPIYAGQDLTDTEDTFHLMFIDLNAGVLRPNTDLENQGAVRINYTFGNHDSFAAFSVYAYCQKSNNGDDMVAWTNALTPDKAMSGYSVVGKISPPVAAINVTPDTVFITAGDNLQLTATAYDIESAVIPGTVFNWTSTDVTVATVNETGYLTAVAEGISTITASSGDVSATTHVTVQRAETPAGGVIPATDDVYLIVANDNGARFNDFGDDSFHIIWTGGGLNALHISNGSSTSYEGEVTQTPERSGTFYVTTTGGRGYFDTIFLCVAVNGTIPDDFRLHIQADGYQWTPNPTPHSEPASDTITYVNATLDEWFTKDDLTYGPQTWRPAAGTTYPIYAGQDVSDTSNQFRMMFIDLYGGALSAHSLRVRYEIENLSSMAAFNAYGYGQNANSVNDCLTTWTNDISSSGWTVLGLPAPVTNFNADKTAGDAPLTVMFTDTSANTPVSWAWDFENDGIIDSTGQNPTHTYAAAGMYTVNLTASNAYGSNSEVKTNYILVSYDSVDFVANVTSGDAPLAVAFTDASTGSPTAWAWDFENDGIIDSTGHNATFIYSSEGTYSVKLSVTADNETKSSVKTDYIQVSPHIPKTWTVGSSGCDFITLADALGSPSVIEGDKVFVYNGTYAASGVIKPVSITGEGAEIVTLDLGGGTVRISGTGTVIEKVRFTNGLLYFNSGSGTYVPPTGVIVRNCIFENMKNPSGQGSIYLGMSNNTLIGNTFRNNNVYNLIYVAASDGTTGNRIENNIFTNTTSTATLKGIIRLATGIGPVICNNTFTDNDMPCILIMRNIGAGTRIYQNDFIVPDGISPVALQGPAAAAFQWISPQEVAYTRQGTAYTKVLGNYWNTYDGTDADGDGIGDTPYTLVTNQIDEAPLIDQVRAYFGQATPQSHTLPLM
jgi:FOG: PKD repeat